LGYLSDLFSKPYPPDREREVEKITLELFQIGKEQDYLSERPGGAYNHQCRHVRTREIGRQLNEIGGLELMKCAEKAQQDQGRAPGVCLGRCGFLAGLMISTWFVIL
jgi:hypothetical protein